MLLEHHIIQSLQYGWKYLADNPTYVDACFSSFVLNSTLFPEWKNYLFPGGSSTKVSIAPAFGHGGMTTPPAILAWVESHNAEEEPLGSGMLEDHSRYVTRSRVKIKVLGPSREITSVLGQLLVAMMANTKDWLLRDATYSGFYFLGAGQVQPEYDLYPELMGVVSQEFQWEAWTTMHLPVFDAQESIFIDKIQVMRDDTPEADGLAVLLSEVADADGDQGEVDAVTVLE